MKPLDTVKITKCTNPNYIGFTGKLYTNLKCFHANAGIFSIHEIFEIDEKETCIGIIGIDAVFWWTKNSDFDVEIALV